MSSHVSDKYWSDPMVLRYSVGSKIEVPSNLLNEVEANIGSSANPSVYLVQKFNFPKMPFRLILVTQSPINPLTKLLKLS